MTLAMSRDISYVSRKPPSVCSFRRRESHKGITHIFALSNVADVGLSFKLYHRLISS